MTNETRSGGATAIVAIVAVLAILAGVAFFFIGSDGDTAAPAAQDIQIDIEAPEMPDVDLPEADLPDVDLPGSE